MKNSTTLRIVLPTAFVLGALMGCSQGRTRPTITPSPQPSSGHGITNADIERAPSVPIEELLSERVPGVLLTRAPDGRMIIRLRGITSLSNDGEPLVVVNGIPLGNAANLGSINRFDIASIEVLKDAASTAMWGIRGANGVIVIRTKGS
jgi:TonB-dependent SusC/RagA subfamily outer membrane receptor